MSGDFPTREPYHRISPSMTRCFKGSAENFLNSGLVTTVTSSSAISYERITQKLDEISRSICTANLDAGPATLISPQCQRKLDHLVDLKLNNRADHEELHRRLTSTFNRLLLELVQAHSHSKCREQEFLRVVKKVGCTLVVPQLIDEVIDRLLKLYRAADHLKDKSFERAALNRYLQKELSQNFSSHQIERTLQTLYWCDSFHIDRQPNKPCRFTLKGEVYSHVAMRDRLDEKMIQLAFEKRIRLSPESFAFLLYGTSNQALVSKIQSILNRLHSPVTVEDLKLAIDRTNDKYGIRSFLKDLKAIEDLSAQSIQDNYNLDSLEVFVCKLSEIRELFFLRQVRRPVEAAGSQC